MIFGVERLFARFCRKKCWKKYHTHRVQKCLSNNCHISWILSPLSTLSESYWCGCGWNGVHTNCPANFRCHFITWPVQPYYWIWQWATSKIKIRIGQILAPSLHKIGSSIGRYFGITCLFAWLSKKKRMWKTVFRVLLKYENPWPILVMYFMIVISRCVPCNKLIWTL